MIAVRLLLDAMSKEAKTVLDIGSWKGRHAEGFISSGSYVTGIDLTSEPITHESYEHIQNAFELHDFEDKKFDLVWCSHTLEHVPNVQMFITKMMNLLEDGGWLYIAVPTDRQQRFHIGHLTLWTPALLVYNLICAGVDCKDARWYTEYRTIGLCLQRKPPIDLSWRTGLPHEQTDLNRFTPKVVRHQDGAWWGNNWHEETGDRLADPPSVTIGIQRTNLPPEVQLDFGPNPELRKKYAKRK